MKALAYLVLVVCVGMGCGSDAHSASLPDAPGSIDAPGSPGQPDAGSVTLMILTGAPPALIAWREETSTSWRVLDVANRAGFEIAVAVGAPFRLVVVCVNAAQASVNEYERTPADGATLHNECGGDPVPTPFTLRGQVNQLGEVFFAGGGRDQGSAPPPWSFTLPVAAGTSDLAVMFGDSALTLDRVAIRRGITVAGDLDLGVIDATTEDTHTLVPISFTPSNPLPGEQLTHFAVLELNGTSAFLSDAIRQTTTTWNAKLAPAEALSSTDLQVVQLEADLMLPSTPGVEKEQRRLVIRDAAVSDSPQVTLPDPMGATTFDLSVERVVATWSSLPAYDTLLVSRIGSANKSVRAAHALLISPSYVAAVGVHAATFDLSDVPGFLNAWKVSPAFPQTLNFQTLLTVSSTERTVSAVTQRLSATTPLAVAAALDFADRAQPGVSSFSVDSSTRRAKSDSLK